MPGLFITATGTDVGKTYVTAGLLRAGLRAGLAMEALKPVLSGHAEAEIAASDAGVLLAALERAVTAETVAAISPWRFAAPLSPDMAAAAEGRTLDFEAIVGTCRGVVVPDRLTLIEGVGGVMAPLDGQHTVLDLIVALDLPVVLVSATGLGAISHCLTACAALKSRGIVPECIVLNETPASTVPIEATMKTLSTFCEGVPLATVPRDAPPRVFDELMQHISSPATRGRGTMRSMVEGQSRARSEG